MYKVNILAGLLGSATAAMGVLSLASPAHAIQWRLDNPVVITGNTSATTVALPGGTVNTENGVIGAGSNVSGSFSWDGTSLTGVNVTALIQGLTGFSPSSISTSFNTYTTFSALGGNLDQIVFGTSIPGGNSNTLTLDFSPAPGLAGGAGIGDTAIVTGGTYNYFTQSNPNVSVGIFSASGNISPGTVTAVPFETDSLALIGSTILFGAGIQVKRKLASKKNKDLS